LNTPCFWWECADIKTDAPPNWQLGPTEVNYLNFETKLIHEDPERGNQNRVYVQVHNRGPLAAGNVTVKAMTAPASAGLPDLPADFWANWPNSAGDANWTPVGSPQVISSLEPLRPEVLEWTWTPPVAADAHTCMLVVMDSLDDPIPAGNKVFDIAQLVTTEKHVGLKNLHLVNLLPTSFLPVKLYLFASGVGRHRYQVRLPSFDGAGVDVSLLFSRALSKRVQRSDLRGLDGLAFSEKELAQLKEHWLEREMRPAESWTRFVKTFDVTREYRVDTKVEFVDVPLAIRPGGSEEMVLLARAARRRSSDPIRVAVQQLTAKGELVGGSTFVFRRAKE